MCEKDFGVRSDRSYLCLIAIYVIHALLLNVFTQPQLDVRSRVTLSSNHVRSSTEHLSVVGRSDSEFVMASPEDGVSSIINSTMKNSKRRTLEEDDTVNSGTPTRDQLLRQSKSSGAATRILNAPKSSGVSRIASNALDTARQFVGSLSPAALGILSGCLVFLLTFTENDYV